MNIEDITPEQGTTQEYSVYRKRLPVVVFAVEREVVNPILLRNTQDSRAETEEIDGELHAQANPEKFVSVERTTGLDLLRFLTEQNGGYEDVEVWDTSEDDAPSTLVTQNYAYNEPAELYNSINLDALTYGIVGTGDHDFAIKSHVNAGYAYTVQPYSLMQGEMRNAVHESGTMKDESGEQASSLFEEVRVKPGNSLLQFVAVESATPGMLAYVTYNLLNSSVYGARGTRSGKTLENKIRAIVTSPVQAHLSSYETLSGRSEQSVTDSLEAYIKQSKSEPWNVYSQDITSFSDEPQWMENLRSLANQDDQDTLFEILQQTTLDAYQTFNDD